MASYRRKHYIEIARLVRDTPISKENREKVVREFVKLFQGDNPLFDEKAFRAVCRAELLYDPKVGHMIKGMQDEKEV